MNKPLNSLPFGIVSLLFLIIALLASVYQLPGKVRASEIEYREAKRISISETFGTNERWYAVAYEAYSTKFQDAGDNKWPAKLCFVQENGKMEQKCFEATRTGTNILPYQWVKGLLVVPIFTNKYPREGVLFTAIVSGGGSGWGRLLTLWTFRQETKRFENVLPKITISNQGEYKIFHGPDDALDGKLVTADIVVGKDEFKWSPHYYRITIYQYDQADKKFRRISEYVTKTKYYSEEINVIGPELENIREIVANKK